MTTTSLVIRTPSGLSGDMLVTGLSRLCQLSNSELATVIDSIGLPGLHDVVSVGEHSVNNISGWKATIELPHEHHHRSLADISNIIAASTMADAAKSLAADTFVYLGKAEAKIHNIPLEQVAFHEVGALDSILDICASAALLVRLDVARVYCSPLPVCDGVIHCEHGVLASPAPAVQEMLRGVPVYGIDSSGETVTPTALAFLRSIEARFGKWPQAEILDVVRAYGGRVLPNVPNGAMFFLVSGPSPV
jgi:pyridinium-3,5-bisthiocarboxylic acid mononucleotide nickel chelatase